MNQSRTSTFLFLTFAVLVSGITANSDSSADGVGALEGTVTIDSTGEPVSGATVTLTAALLTFSTVTDENGAFRLNGIPPGSDYRVTVTKEGFLPSPFSSTIHSGETARARFTMPAASLTLVSPNGGEAIFAGSEVPIRWRSAGIDSVRIEFSFNSGRNWMVLEEHVEAVPGVYIWDVQDIPSPDYMIRITDTGTSGLSDTSDSPFKNSSM